MGGGGGWERSEEGVAAVIFVPGVGSELMGSVIFVTRPGPGRLRVSAPKADEAQRGLHALGCALSQIFFSKKLQRVQLLI